MHHGKPPIVPTSAEFPETPSYVRTMKHQYASEDFTEAQRAIKHSTPLTFQWSFSSREDFIELVSCLKAIRLWIKFIWNVISDFYWSLISVLRSVRGSIILEQFLLQNENPALLDRIESRNNPQPSTATFFFLVS